MQKLPLTEELQKPLQERPTHAGSIHMVEELESLFQLAVMVKKKMACFATLIANQDTMV